MKHKILIMIIAFFIIFLIFLLLEWLAFDTRFFEVFGAVCIVLLFTFLIDLIWEWITGRKIK